MKKFLFSILCIVIVTGMATIVWASVIGSPHELAPEPCAMCHTPHHAADQYPLWNRYQATQEYDMYESITFDMTPALEPRAPSILCLTCHNGILSGLVNYPGPCSVADSAYDLEISGCADLGTDLTNDHPISFDYVSTDDADGNVFPAALQVVGGRTGRLSITGSISGTQYFLYGEGSTLANWFECTTCHSVHDTEDYPGKGDYQVFFLRNDNTGSTMCLDCHTAR
jgi:hypothetical protein